MDASVPRSILEPRGPAEEQAFEDWLPKVTAMDVLNECADAEEALQAAMLVGDAELIGRLVLAVRSAYARRLALRDVYAASEGITRPTTEEAVAEVLDAATGAQANQLIRAHGKAQQRRFTGQPLTGFGALA